MPELIDRQVAIDSIYVVAESIICSVEEERPEIADKIVAVRDLILKKIKEQPTIEPEVRHGRWIERQMDLICSVCKWEYSDELRFMSNNGLDSMEEAFAHCPHCGARMDATEPQKE